MQELDLIWTDEKVCIFQNDWLLLFFFVNDIVALCRTADLSKLHEFKNVLMTKYEIRYIDNLYWFLNIQIIQNHKQWKLWLFQFSYIKTIVKHFWLNYETSVCILMNAEDYIKYDEKISSQQIHLYQKKIESILYMSIITRSDVVKTVLKLSEFLQNPSLCHHAAAD